jgi:hypothetical protein
MIVKIALPGLPPPITIVVGVGVSVNGGGGGASAGAEEVGAGICRVVVNVLLALTVWVTVLSGGVEGAVAGEEAAGGGLDDAEGAAAGDEGGRKPVTERVVALANAGGDELEDVVEPLEDLVELVVGDIAKVVVELNVKPSSAAATALSAQPTNTPFVVFIGSAKHCWPVLQTLVMTKLPCLSHVPTLPAMQAISPPVQGDEKLSVEKRLLYPSASARFASKMAGDTVPVAGGAD